MRSISMLLLSLGLLCGSALADRPPQSQMEAAKAKESKADLSANVVSKDRKSVV